MVTLQFLCSAYRGEFNEVMPAIHPDNELLNARWEGASTKIGNDVKVRRGDTVLMMACKGGQLELVNALRVRGADVHARNINNHNTLMQACMNGYRAIAAVLLDAGVDVNAIDIDGFTALHYAVITITLIFARCSYPEVQT